MKQPTVTSFFLGANSASGFYSLYDYFCTAPSDTLHIIKSGPGTGKSTFMRRIGNSAEAHGLDVEYILCSGDPDSLDGVYIPALHTGWVDGTAPHIIEPKLFGAAADYENLGRFCNSSLLKQRHEPISAITAQYKAHYQSAYTYLDAAGKVFSHKPHAITPDAEQKLRRRAHSKICRELNKHNASGSPAKRFVRAFSCHGSHTLTHTINTLCNRMCVLESHCKLEQIFFEEIISVLAAQGAQCILCPNPLCPTLTDAVILPLEGLCFFASEAAPAFKGAVRTIHLDAYLSNNSLKQSKQQTRLYDALLNSAFQELQTAKQLHDELESCYRSALDTQALNEYTATVIHALFQ